MKSRNNGFTFIEIMAALFICSLIFVYLIPNMVKQYSNLSKAEKELEMRELLYEEISNHKDQKYFKVRRESYVIIVSGIRWSLDRKNDGFTLIELIVSLFLLTILTVLLMLILETTVKTSKRFMNYTDYEYALAHKKIFEIYNSSNVVDRFSNHIVMESKDNKEEVLLIFRGDRVFLEKKKNTNSYVGNILLLKKLKGYSINQDGNLLKISIIDRNNKKRILHLKLKKNK